MTILSQTTQTVTVAGNTVLVGGLSISRSRGNPAEIGFSIERDVVGATAFNATELGAAVTVSITDGTTPLSWSAEISAVEDIDLGRAGIKRVTARSDEAKFQRIRMMAEWVDELASDVITDIITAYGTTLGISAGSLVDGGAKVATVSSRFDTLYDIIEATCQQTGLAWRVVSNQINLFSPDSVSSPNLTDGDFIDGTCNITTKLDGVYNVARMLAYEYVYIEIYAQACSTYEPLPLGGPDWELTGEIVFPEAWTSEMLSALKFQLDFEGMLATWNQSEYPFFAKFYVRRPVWVTREDATSISTYGRREAAPLPNDGGITRAAAVALCDYFLLVNANPFAEVRGIQPTEWGFDSDSTANINLSARSFNQDVYITSVNIAADLTDHVVTIDAATQSGIGTSPDPAREMLKRIEKLERRNLNPTAADGPPVSQPVITLPPGQLAVKNGDTIAVSGAGTPNKVLDTVSQRDAALDEIVDGSVASVTYDSDSGNFGGSFTMGTNTTAFIRLEAILASDYGSSFIEESRSNPLDVNNQEPTDTTISINSGDPSTSDPNLTLTLSATGAYQMYIDGVQIADGANVRTWITYSTSANIAIAEGFSGVITVGVTYRNNAFKEATEVTDTITYTPV